MNKMVWCLALLISGVAVASPPTTQSSFGVSLTVKQPPVVSAPNAQDQRVLEWFPADATPQTLESLHHAGLLPDHLTVEQLNDATKRSFSMHALLQGPQADEVAEFMSTHGESFSSVFVAESESLFFASKRSHARVVLVLCFPVQRFV